ncbi:ABC transporter permease subunit [Nocardiopsis lucentensis]|uniref:ABC transporter permease subunit n=1 Tax=Nocardiopsis lucentensis TaxID=53441 RepID=UPI00034A2866|nr:ABC transporter permease subunit [Nocardiopsis lucentensis]
MLSTLLSAVLGVALALLIRRMGARRVWAARLAQANLAVPHLVGALCVQLLISEAGLFSSLAHAVGLTDAPSDFPALTADGFGFGIMAEYVWKETPFLALLALAALGRGADELESAARVLGARPWQRLTRVTLPLVAPAGGRPGSPGSVPEPPEAAAATGATTPMRRSPHV